MYCSGQLFDQLITSYEVIYVILHDLKRLRKMQTGFKAAPPMTVF